MRMSQFFSEFILDHADIQKIEDLPDQHSVVIHMGFSNWMQQSYKAGQPEFVEGLLVLSGVEDFLSDPGLNTLVFGQHADGEVMSYGHVPVRDKPGLEAGEIVIEWWDHNTHIAIVVILSFLARDVQWIPHDSSPTSN